MPDESHQIRRTRTFLVGLAAIAVALVVAVYAVNLYRERIADDQTARYVNTSGRQRMLSQRIALLADIVVEVDTADAAEMREEFLQHVDEFETSHVALRDGSVELGLTRPRIEELDEIFFGEEFKLDQQVAEFIALAREFHAAEEQATARQIAKQLRAQANDSQLLPDLDALVPVLEQEGIERAQHSRSLLTGLVIAIALLFALLFILIRPSVRALQRARDRASLASERLQAFIASAKDHAIITLDLNGNITSWNQGAERLGGYTEQEALGMNYSRFYTEEGRKKGEPAKELAVIHAGESNEFEGWRVRKDGSKYWANVVVSPLHNASGRITGYSKIMRDLTERRRLEERFRASIEGSPACMVMIDQQGAIVLVNQKTEMLFGYEHGELLGKAVDILLPEEFLPTNPNQLANVFEFRKQCSTGPVFISGRHKDGRSLPLEAGLTPVETDEGMFALAAISDVSEMKAAKAAIVESESRFQIIANCAPVSMWVCDDQAKCIWLNQQWLTYAGSTLEEHTGMGWLSILHPEDVEQAKEAYLGAFERREPFTVEYRLLRHDGQYRWHTAIGTPRINDAGEFYGYVGLSIDDHDARTAHNELERLNNSLQESAAIHRALIDQSNNFLGLMTPEGRLIDANRTALAAAGVAREEILGQPFWKTPWWEHSEELQLRLQDAVTKVAAGDADSFEATHIANNGETICVDFSLKPVKDHNGEVIYLIPEGCDVTLHKQREKELSNLLEELDKSNKELEQFAYIASHDLQEPLRKIAAYGELLREEYGEALSDEGGQYLSVVMGGATRLQTLIRDLLSFSRITTRGAPLAPTPAEHALHDALSDLEVAIAERDAQITFDPLPTVFADESQLTRLFQNLVGNGLKYCQAERPEIHIGGQQQGDMFEFFVRDNGIGIEPEYFERIFGIFQRLHNRREYSGTGIGLALCKRTIERFGGDIRVESTPGAGSTFYFTIPLAKEREISHDGPRAYNAHPELGVGTPH